MPEEYLSIEKLEVTQRFEALSDAVWELVMTWPRIAQNTLGEQILRSADSVGANIIEGGYRETQREALRFFIYARGSAGETSYFIRRAINRKLTSKEDGERLLTEWTGATQLLNNLIRYRRSRLSAVRETPETYSAEVFPNT